MGVCCLFWKLQLPPREHPPCRMAFWSDAVVFWWTASLPLSDFFLCLVWSLCHAHRLHRSTSFDDLCIIWRLSAQRCAFWGICLNGTPFKGSYPQNLPNFGGVNGRFQAEHMKHMRWVIHLNVATDRFKCDSACVSCLWFSSLKKYSFRASS